jgi:hypothetical protein
MTTSQDDGAQQAPPPPPPSQEPEVVVSVQGYKSPWDYDEVRASAGRRVEFRHKP